MVQCTGLLENLAVLVSLSFFFGRVGYPLKTPLVAMVEFRPYDTVGSVDMLGRESFRPPSYLHVQTTGSVVFIFHPLRASSFVAPKAPPVLWGAPGEKQRPIARSIGRFRTGRPVISSGATSPTPRVGRVAVALNEKTHTRACCIIDT